MYWVETEQAMTTSRIQLKLVEQMNQTFQQLYRII